MDWEYRYQVGHTPWDKGAPHPSLLDFFGRQVLRGKVLVPGCGFGHDALALAQQGAEVTAIDLAPTAIAQASHWRQQFGTGTGQLDYHVADLFDLPPSWAGTFDWVWEHTCFCALDPSLRAAYVKTVATLLKPGGSLVGIFLVDPTAVAGPPFGISLADLDQAFAPHFQVLEHNPPAKTYVGREGREGWRWLRKLA